MKRINFSNQVANILEHNKDGSFSTQSARYRILMQSSKELKELGFKSVTTKNLGARHIEKLVGLWKAKDLSTATIKNRVSHFRWLSQKINKQNIIPRTNQELSIPNRKYADNSINKAKELDLIKLDNLSEKYQLSLQLQREFGLRREESLKFIVSYADKTDKIILKSSWCKGGRAREILVRTDKQRALLNKINNFVGKGSLIPKDKTYIQHLKAFEISCIRADIKNMHGYRHQYAQDRYKELTGLNCPKAGGLKSKELSSEQKELDYKARMIISGELGHGREEITVQYLGR